MKKDKYFACFTSSNVAIIFPKNLTLFIFVARWRDLSWRKLYFDWNAWRSASWVSRLHFWGYPRDCKKMHLFFSFDLFYFPKASLRAITFLEENLAISFLLPEEQIYDFHSEFCMSCRARERRIIFHHMDDKSVLLLIFFDIITLGKSACEIRIPFVSFCVLFRRRTHGWRSHVCTENCTHDILLLIGATTKRYPPYPTSWWSKLGDELSTLNNILTMKGFFFLNF